MFTKIRYPELTAAVSKISSQIRDAPQPPHWTKNGYSPGEASDPPTIRALAIVDSANLACRDSSNETVTIVDFILNLMEQSSEMLVNWSCRKL